MAALNAPEKPPEVVYELVDFASGAMQRRRLHNISTDSEVEDDEQPQTPDHIRKVITRLLAAAQKGEAATNVSLFRLYFHRIGLLIIYVVICATDPVVRAASKKRVLEGAPRQFLYSPASVAFLASVISVVVGNTVAGVTSGMSGMSRCWNVRMLMRMAAPAMLFTVSNMLKFFALLYMPVDMITLLDQLSLVALALMMELFLRKRHSSPQWCSLIIVSVSMLQYMALRDEDRHKTHKSSPVQMTANLWRGISLMVPQVLCTVFGSILCEQQLKNDKDSHPFWEQKAAMEVTGSLVALIGFWLDEQAIKQGLFYGWDAMTWATLAMMLAKLWLAGIITKMFDSIAKQLGSCVAMLLVYFETLCLPEPFGQGDMKFDYNTFVALLVVALSVTSFIVSTRYTQMAERDRELVRDFMNLCEGRLGNTQQQKIMEK